MSTTKVEAIIKRWDNHRQALEKIVGIFPEDQVNFKPTSEVMSLIELIHHVSWTPEFFLAAIEERKINIPPVPKTIADAQKLLDELTKEHMGFVKGLTDEDLQRQVVLKRMNKTESIEDILYRIITHEAHHKGQLMLYARLLGIKPPFYTVY